MLLYCCLTCPTLTTALKLLYYRVSISSSKNKMPTNLETNILNVFLKCLLCAIYFTKYFKFITFVFNFVILYLNIYTLFQPFPGNSYRFLFFFFPFFLSCYRFLRHPLISWYQSSGQNTFFFFSPWCRRYYSRITE